MHKSFLPLFILSLLGVLFASFLTHAKPYFHWIGAVPQWLGLAAGIVPLIVYQFNLHKKDLLSPPEIDSIYYFGFLITVITLVSTAISIAIDTNPPKMQWILLQFGLGLVATGYALFARLMLMSKSSSQVEMDVVQSTRNLAVSIGQVASEFDRAGYEATAFAEQFKVRLENLLQQSTETFRNTIEESAQLSLNRCATSIDAATVNFSNAITSVLDEVARVQVEAEAISFSAAADRIKIFSKEIEGSINGIADQVKDASSVTAAGISELASTTRKVQKLAIDIAAKLQNLNEVGKMVEVIIDTSEALELFKSSATDSSTSLNKLIVISNEASKRLDNEIVEPLGGSKFSTNLVHLTHTLPKNAADLSSTLSELNSQSTELSKALEANRRQLNTSITSIGGSNGNLQNLDKSAKLVADALSDLQKSIIDVKASLNSVSAVSYNLSPLSSNYQSVGQWNVGVSATPNYLTPLTPTTTKDKVV